MNAISKLLFVSLFGIGCASAQVGQTSVADLRGNLVVSGAAEKAIVVGPADLHAYAGFKGGEVYTVPAVAGRDADCAAPHAGGRAIEADRTAVVHVGAGQVACVATTNARGLELVWHARAPKTGEKTEEIAVASAPAIRGRAQ
jgi:hypothetical protein